MNAVPAKLGFYASLVAFLATVGYSIVQIAQVLGWLSAPLDAILIYGFSLGIAVPFLLALLALFYITPPERKIWSHAAVLFAVIYVVYVTLNYVVQLATVIPAMRNGTLSEIRVLDQTPHSLFWDVDGLGYLFMGLASLFAWPVFSKNGVQRWARLFFLANALITPVIAVIYFYPHFSIGLLLAGLPWVITAPGAMWCLARCFSAELNPQRGKLLYPQEDAIQILLQ